jgi:hypothetical protein
VWSGKEHVEVRARLPHQEDTEMHIRLLYLEVIALFLQIAHSWIASGPWKGMLGAEEAAPTMLSVESISNHRNLP